MSMPFSYTICPSLIEGIPNLMKLSLNIKNGSIAKPYVDEDVAIYNLQPELNNCQPYWIESYPIKDSIFNFVTNNFWSIFVHIFYQIGRVLF